MYIYYTKLSWSTGGKWYRVVRTCSKRLTDWRLGVNGMCQ